MIPLDSEAKGSRAIVIDGNAVSRGSLVATLRDFGVPEVTHACRPLEARRKMELNQYDIVVCDFHFDGEVFSGIDLLDELRAARLLPLSTVVIMISSEAGHSEVSEAAEAALDAYLIKPHTADALLQRLIQARQRKRAIRDVVSLIDRAAYSDAAALCQKRFEARGAAWLQAARLGSDLWLRLGNPRAAQCMFDAILEIGAVPWAKLGIARAQLQRGNVVLARRSLETLLNDQPGYSDAHDVMARVLLEQGLPDQALAASRSALALTPGSIARLVKHGLLAFLFGDSVEAGETLSRAARYGLNSKAFDLQGLVLLAFIQFDAKDARGLSQSARSISSARADQMDSDRLRRFEGVVEVLTLLLERRIGDAVSRVKQLTKECMAPSFEFEAACNLLALTSRLAQGDVQVESLAEDVRRLAQRFAVSHTTCEMLVRSASNHLSLGEIVRGAYAQICAKAQDAVSHTIKGAPGEAVKDLLDGAETTLNAKLMDLAAHTLERHAANILDSDPLRERVEMLHKAYRTYGTQVSLGRAISESRI